MPKKLAITIAGAVSLGSYEAGVLYEVLEAIAAYNSAPGLNPNDRIEIDVLTGASAGGMTAIILAQKLLFSANEFRGPYDNPLYNIWVERISLEGLQTPAEDEPALFSLFSSSLIETISREALLQRYSAAPAPLAPAVSHPAAAAELRVGVALTNLNGVAYEYPVTPGGQFTYIDYSDQMTRHVVPADCDTPAFWEDLRQAAVACGAFPFAFRTRDVGRSRSEKIDYHHENLADWAHDPMPFTYSDGGILQNQPLGMAKNLVDMIDNHQQDRRYYLFVSPHAKDPAVNDTFHSANAEYFRLLLRLITVVMGQSGFQDWITAKEMNARIQTLDLRAKGLMQAIVDGAIDVGCLATTADSLLKLFFPNGEHLSVGAQMPEKLADAQARIALRYKDYIGKLQPGQADAYRDAVLAFETAAGLGARDHMTIYGITAMDSELAGSGLEAFLGFFDQKFREHDYNVGRRKARAILQDPALGNPGELGPFPYAGSDIRPIDPRLNGLKLNQVPHADLMAFKKGMRKRLNQALKEMWGPALALLAEPGSDLILESVLDRMIEKM